MKPGDLVTSHNGLRIELYNDVFAENFHLHSKNISTGITLNKGEIGTILEMKKVRGKNISFEIIKVLTKSGIGWVYKHGIRVVE
jgi:hypothetical protein